MWKLQPTTECEEALISFAESSPRPLTYLLTKQHLVLSALNLGGRPQNLRFNFLRGEGKGVYRIGCSGKGMRVLRLYLLPDEATFTLHQITIGDKNTQKSDIRHCHQFADQVRLSNNKAPNEKTKVHIR